MPPSSLRKKPKVLPNPAAQADGYAALLSSWIVGRHKKEGCHTMKRDLDLIRKIVLTVEDLPTGNVPEEIEVDGYTSEQVGYHSYLNPKGVPPALPGRQ